MGVSRLKLTQTPSVSRFDPLQNVRDQFSLNFMSTFNKVRPSGLSIDVYRDKRMKKQPSSKPSQNGFIRIIGGKYRGRKLPVKDVEGLRPTTDRVKETLFNWLMNDVRDSTVLDCFAGSGGLGFEALSRFARSVTFLEKDKIAFEQLQKNIQTINTADARAIHTDTLLWLAKSTPEQFNLVLIDPPFRKGFAQPVCEHLEQQQWLADDALIYIEVEQELTLSVPSNWELLKEKTAGQVSYRLYTRQGLNE